MKTLIRFVIEEDGTTVPEYALIAGMISLAAISAMVLLGIKFLVLFVS